MGLRRGCLPCTLTLASVGRPCVDCHAFEFMQRALQDLRKTAYSLDSRVSPPTRPGGAAQGGRGARTCATNPSARIWLQMLASEGCSGRRSHP